MTFGRALSEEEGRINTGRKEKRSNVKKYGEEESGQRDGRRRKEEEKIVVVASLCRHKQPIDRDKRERKNERRKTRRMMTPSAVPTMLSLPFSISVVSPSI